MPTKKIASNIKNSIKTIYVVHYEPIYYSSLDNNISLTIKAFKNKKDAILYVDSRNFEFQTVCLSDADQYEHYVLTNDYKDHVITIFDLRTASSYIYNELAEYSRDIQEQKDIPQSIIAQIKPFNYISVQYFENLN
jgi:hypothetical protein